MISFGPLGPGPTAALKAATTAAQAWLGAIVEVAAIEPALDWTWSWTASFAPTRSSTTAPAPAVTVALSEVENIPTTRSLGAVVVIAPLEATAEVPSAIRADPSRELAFVTPAYSKIAKRRVPPFTVS